MTQLLLTCLANCLTFLLFTHMNLQYLNLWFWPIILVSDLTNLSYFWFWPTLVFCLQCKSGLKFSLASAPSIGVIASARNFGWNEIWEFQWNINTGTRRWNIFGFWIFLQRISAQQAAVNRYQNSKIGWHIPLSQCSQIFVSKIPSGSTVTYFNWTGLER